MGQIPPDQSLELQDIFPVVGGQPAPGFGVEGRRGGKIELLIHTAKQ
ncbi:MAG: hypothetical protein KJZ86_11140 [Caldilineaceae bacterium]|nr:hypothetical protein [Caldilineaceae bacterium]